MDFQILTTLDAFDAMQEEWNGLARESVSLSPFLRHEYLRAWFDGLGGGEWPSGTLRIVTAQRAGRLIGAAPFFQTTRAGETLLVLLGGIEISDRLDLLARPADLPAFVEGLCAALETQTWDAMELYNLPAESPTLAVLPSACAARGWVCTPEPFRPSLYVPLPGDWEAYLAGIDKKQRHEIRRKMRRAEESGRDVRWYAVGRERGLDSEMEDFLALMAHDAEKAAFLTAPMRAQMKAIAQAAFEHGWLQLAFLEVDGRKACGYLNFDYGGRIWVYNSGLDPHFMDLSPGWVLLGHLLRHACEQGRSEFDFMRGDEDYKVRFGGRRREVWKVRVDRR